jgi:arylformamidase
MDFKELYDISVPISSKLAVWPGDPSIEIEYPSKMSEGAAANVSRLIMGAHTGTHMDAPLHFIPGATSIDQVPLEVLVGTALVVEMAIDHHIGAADLEKANIPSNCQRIIFKTPNSQFWQTDPNNFHTEFIAVAPDGADWLNERGVKLVGVDYLSVEQYDAPFEHPTHQKLLSQRVVVVEGLNLSGIEPGEYTLMALPLRITGNDGAPSRVVLAR